MNETNKAMSDGLTFEQAYRLGVANNYASLGMLPEAVAWLWSDKAANEIGEY